NPPQQRTNSKGHKLSKMILIVEWPANFTPRIAEGMSINPQELAIAGEKLCQSHAGYDDCRDSDTLQQPMNVTNCLNPVHYQEEQHDIRNVHHKSGARCTR